MRPMRCALLVALPWAGACEPSAPAPQSAAQRGSQASAAPARGWSPVVQQALGRLQREIDQSPPPAVSDEAREEVDGLLSFAASAPAAQRADAFADLLALGAEGVEPLAAALNAPLRSAAQRTAAAEVLALLDDPRAAEQLLLAAEGSGEAWLRAQCAWRLGQTSQDQVLPRLVLRLKYETDYETVLWTAVTCAHFGNYSGLEGLRTIASSAGDPALASSAAQRLLELASAVGASSPQELERWWLAGDPQARLARPTASARLQLEIWRWIARFSEFQLRGVDDARFALSRLDATAAEALASALADENSYVRLHSAQALERMGPRAQLAGPALVQLLDDREAGMQAALALGAIGWPQGRLELEARLSAAQPLELRLAAARALGRLGQPQSAAPLQRLADDPAELLELRQAAAESLCACGAGAQALPVLCLVLSSSGLDRSTTELALERWLESRAAQGDERARSALEAWQVFAGPPGKPLSPGELERRQSQRGALLLERFGLAGGQ